MKTLSIKNPWAYLIAAGIKDVENRSWPTKHRGKILIHATRKDAHQDFTAHSLLTPAQFNLLSNEDKIKLLDKNFVRSAIIGEVEIVGCVDNSKSVWAEPRQWHWELKNPVLYERPIMGVNGSLSLWDFKQ